MLALSKFVRHSKPLIYHPRASISQWNYWPDPLSQQNLDEFLNDINYFNEPREFIDIGLKLPPKQKLKFNAKPESHISPQQSRPDNLDQVLDILSLDTKIPDLDYKDVKLTGPQLVKCAVNFGIFRDLFDNFDPDYQNDIHFTPQQAERLDKLVPHFWITDQPYARVNRHPKKSPPEIFFNPTVDLDAKFIHNTDDCNTDVFSHSSFYGNIIPASQALSKPSITIDGKSLSTATASKVQESENWTPGRIRLTNFDQLYNKYISLALVNLDSVHDNSSHLHWLVSNITQTANAESQSVELAEYLPVHGIRGFGYSRYVFVLFQHDSAIEGPKIEGFDIKDRKFSAKKFLETHQASGMTPVGLSWFQTVWDESSNKVFHDYMKTKAPVYDYVQPKSTKRPDMPYPGRIPFNVYLDHTRDPKEIDEHVFLERMKTVDPFEYQDIHKPPVVPPTVFEDPPGPSWQKTDLFKRKNMIGHWRGLRPASGLLPLDNNADLDRPIRPLPGAKHSPVDAPNLYPSQRRPKSQKNTSTSKPANEHQSVYVQEGYEEYVEEAKKLIKS